mgnify:CR=1 FL=1
MFPQFPHKNHYSYHRTYILYLCCDDVVVVVVVVVEQVDTSASLYARSVQNQHICLLVKHQVTNYALTVLINTIIACLIPILMELYRYVSHNSIQFGG